MLQARTKRATLIAKPLAVTEDTFEQEVLKSDLPVLVDFWAEWCGPCRMVAPIVEELAGEYTGRLKVAKVDVDDNQRLAIRYQIMSIPTLGVFRGGEMIERHCKLVCVGCGYQRDCSDP